MRTISLLLAMSALLAQDATVTVTSRAKRGGTSANTSIAMRKLPGVKSVTCTPQEMYIDLPATFSCEVVLDRISDMAPYDVSWSFSLAGVDDPRFVASPQILTIPKGADRATVTVNFTPAP